MMDWNDSDVGWSGWLTMTLVMGVFWALVAIVVVVVARSLGSDRESGPGGRSEHRNPQQLLDERFARGEIDADEYRARSDALREQAGGP